MLFSTNAIALLEDSLKATTTFSLKFGMYITPSEPTATPKKNQNMEEKKRITFSPSLINILRRKFYYNFLNTVVEYRLFITLGLRVVGFLASYKAGGSY